jgi:hypothetical protein
MTANSSPPRIHKRYLERFEKLIGQFILSDNPIETGLPSVALLRRQTQPCQLIILVINQREYRKILRREYIQAKIIDVAKDKLIFDSDKTINDNCL